MWMWEQRDYARSSVAGRPKELGPGCAENDPAYSSYPIAKLEFGPAHADPASKQGEVPEILLARPGLWIPNATHLPNPYAGRLLLAAGWLIRWSSRPATRPAPRPCVRPRRSRTPSTTLS